MNKVNSLLAVLSDHYSDPPTQVAVDFKSESDVCHSSQNLAPSSRLKFGSQCVVANVDADAAHNKELAAKYDISSFPTIKFFSKDNKEPEAYTGGRSEDAFVAYLNEKCGTHRSVGGGLNDQVRFRFVDRCHFCILNHAITRLEDMPNWMRWLASFLWLPVMYGRPSSRRRLSLLLRLEKPRNTTSERWKKLSVARRLTWTRKGNGKGRQDVFLLLIPGWLIRGPLFLNSLAKILGKGNLAPLKLDEIKIKANIIRAFVEQKVAAAKEKTEGISRNSAEL